MNANSALLLPQRDREFLRSKALVATVCTSPSGLVLTIADYSLTDAYTPLVTDLRIVLPPGYDNASPDMFWTRPTVLKRDGQYPLAADHMQPFDDGTWQRWSRHFTTGWRPGIDGLRSYLASIRRELARGL